MKKIVEFSNNKGITLSSLVIYITVVFVIFVMIIRVTNHFKNNMVEVADVTFEKELEKFNMYFLNETKKTGNSVSGISQNEITFSTGNQFEWNSENEAIYFSDNESTVKICEGITGCVFASESLNNGREKITVTITMGQNEKTLNYVMDATNTAWLDSEALNGKTYRELFLTGNIISNGDMITNDNTDGWVQYGEVPMMGTTSEDYSTKDTCFKVATTANTSMQAIWRNGNDSTSPLITGHKYLLACTRKLVSYTAGNKFGVWLSNGAGVTSSTTTGQWENSVAIETMAASQELFVGSGGNAILEGYIDNVVAIDLTSIYGSGNEPSIADATTAYNKFIEFWTENETEIESITASYTQNNTKITTTSSLDDLRDNLIVTVTYDDDTVKILYKDDDYSLSGVLTEGTSTITVTYGGETTTFTVNVTA